jgi:Protein of unknown function (Hypoth_ymh)
MLRPEPFFISTYARDLAELKKLPIETQALLLLKRFKTIYYDHKVQPERFSKQNILNRSAGYADPHAVVSGFPEEEKWPGVEHLLVQPWFYLEQNFYIASMTGDGWFHITDPGLQKVNDQPAAHLPDKEILCALKFLHPDLQNYGHYFYEAKLTDAVAAAFRRIDNKLIEVRDQSGNLAVAHVSGVALPRKLIDAGVLKFPFSQLSAGNQTWREAYTGEIKNLLSSSIGWFRNSFQHEPHNFPPLSERDALEYLFVASHVLHTIDKMV